MIESKPWRVVMFTAIADFIPLIEGCLQERGHRLVGLVGSAGPRSRRTDDYLEVAQHARPGRDVVITNHPNRIADMIRPIRPDLIICAGFNWKVPADALEVPTIGAINVHDSLLPKYRGRNATGWALRSGDPEYGVSLHYMLPEFDTGPVVAQRRVEITDDDYSNDSILPRWLKGLEEATIEALDRIAAGYPGTPQDESLASHTSGAFELEWREIDWADDTRHNFLKIRSWYGARDVPRGAFGIIDGKRCLIMASRLSGEVGLNAEPGTVLERRVDGTVLIQCGDGPLEILEWSEVA